MFRVWGRFVSFCFLSFFLSFFLSKNTRQIPLQEDDDGGRTVSLIGRRRRRRRRRRNKSVVSSSSFTSSPFLSSPGRRRCVLKVCSHQWGNIIIIISFLISSLSRWNNTHTIEEECSKRRLRRGLASREIGKGREIQQGTQRRRRRVLVEEI